MDEHAASSRSLVEIVLKLFSLIAGSYRKTSVISPFLLSKVYPPGPNEAVGCHIYNTIMGIICISSYKLTIDVNVTVNLTFSFTSFSRLLFAWTWVFSDSVSSEYNSIYGKQISSRTICYLLFYLQSYNPYFCFLVESIQEATRCLIQR